jgi:vacuolar-type H+-ATPase catalytic subunit A/Vma1
LFLNVIHKFIEYGKLVQQILYFVGYDNLTINEENTNKLDWNVAKKFWNENILDYFLSYNPFGPKNAIESYKMLNLTYNYIESLDKEALKNYNAILARIADFIFGSKYHS